MDRRGIWPERSWSITPARAPIFVARSLGDHGLAGRCRSHGDGEHFDFFGLVLDRRFAGRERNSTRRRAVGVPVSQRAGAIPHDESWVPRYGDPPLCRGGRGKVERPERAKFNSEVVSCRFSRPLNCGQRGERYRDGFRNPRRTALHGY